jgi:hypothetical protein
MRARASTTERDPGGAGPVPLVSVHPPAAAVGLTRLLSALEATHPVRLVAGDAGAGGRPAARILLDARDGPAPDALPRLAVDPDPGREAAGAVRLSHAPGVDRRLRGVCLPGGRGPAVRAAPGDEVLAARSGAPVWVRRAGARPEYAIADAPRELRPGEPLSAVLRPDGSAWGLPVVAFLRGVCAGHLFDPPGLRATFLFDDPNLHRPSYGHLDYARLARDAAAHGYHAAMATVPADSWWVSRRAAAIFRANPRRLSLLVHGVDHLPAELGRQVSVPAAAAALWRGLARVRSLERRAGVRVARVMAPPHHACGPVAAEALALTGFDALCQVDDRPLAADPALAGWDLADWTREGLPAIPRIKLPSRDDGSDAGGIEALAAGLALHAYLDHALVLYGHHYDAAPGLRPLREAAARVAALGPVTWASPALIAEGNVSVRAEGDLLRIRPGSRRVRVVPPPGTTRLRVETPAGTEADAVIVSAGPGAAPARGAPWSELPLPGPGPLVVRLRREGEGAGIGRAPGPGLRTLARRGAAEARDRLSPLLDRVRGAAA